LPRAFARRKIPLAARAESANRSLTVVSKTSDNEYSTAALGNSEVASVKYSPRAAIPELGQRCENDSKVSALGRGEEPNDVLNEEPSWSKLICDPGKLKEESRPLPGEPCPLARDAEILTRESTREEINPFRFIIHAPNVVINRRLRPMPTQHPPAPLINLGLPRNLHPRTLQPQVKAANPGERGTDDHNSSLIARASSSASRAFEAASEAGNVSGIPAIAISA
jgi:hypothetical protein